MSFLVRIFFSGLMVFSPSPDGNELTVLLLDAGHGFHASDGSEVEAHKPLLLAHAGSCTGQCPTADAAAAAHLFPGVGSAQAHDSLALAVAGGGVWQLSAADVSLRPSQPTAGTEPTLVIERGSRRVEGGSRQAVPTSPLEREDFSWVADLDSIYPQGGGINPALLSGQPPCGLVAARLRLRSGKVYTYRVAEVSGRVEPVHFQPLAGGAESPYRQAVATWVAADVQVSGDSLEVVEEAFAGGERRTMRLSPRQGIVELALLNLPPLVVPPGEVGLPLPGKHFERYFDLARTVPEAQVRPVPQAAPRSVAVNAPAAEWDAVHPSESEEAPFELVARLGLGARGPYDRVICPIGGFGGGFQN